MAMAAIYENWLGADGSEIETMAILTTAANATMSVLHDRMPVMIAPEHFEPMARLPLRHDDRNRAFARAGPGRSARYRRG